MMIVQLLISLSSISLFAQIQACSMAEAAPASEEVKTLVEAIKSGSVEETEKVLATSGEAIVNELDPELKQPSLYFAALTGSDEVSVELFKLLISHGANCLFKDSIDQTVLFYVCRDGKEQCVELLLSHGLSLEDVDVYGQTPMFYAASENQIDLVRKYATKERVNHADNLASQTPLYYAARRGHLELCKVLVEKGADVGHADSSGKTAVEFARKGKYTEVAEFLSTELRRVREVGKFSHQSYSIEESNLEKRKKKEESQKTVRQTYKIVFLNSKGEPQDLTEEEVRKLVQLKPELEAFLCNPESIPNEMIESGGAEVWERAAGKLLNMCCRLKGSYWFAEPVDPAKFNIMDYFDIVSQPMDLSTVRKKLMHNCYHSASEFVQDMELIWQNCYKYNGETHDISKCAKEVQAAFNEHLTVYGLEKFLQPKG